MKTKIADSARPVFAIVGLHFWQEAQVARRCRDLASLRSVDANRSETSLPTAHAVFLLVRFIEHRWTEAAYRAFPRGRVFLHAGGMSSLVTKIKVLASGAPGQHFFWRKKERPHST